MYFVSLNKVSNRPQGRGQQSFGVGVRGGRISGLTHGALEVPDNRVK